MSKKWKIWSIVGGLLALLAIVANVFTVFPETRSWFSSSKASRLAAIDCRKKGYTMLEEGKRAEAAIAFKCAEQSFRTAIEAGDKVSLWGLSLLYGDEKVHGLVATNSAQLSTLANEYWCKARREGVQMAAGEPPFADKLKC